MVWRRDDDYVDVLAVCTGNLCRSPMLATLLGAALPSLIVTSAGTHAPRGTPWHPNTVRVLTDAGYRATGVARRLRRSQVRGAQLILTAEAAHRGVVVRLDKSAAARTYTLLEAERLLRKAPVPPGYGIGRLGAHLADALAAFPLEKDDDLPDPLLGDLDAFRRCLASVQRAVTVLVPALRR